MHVTGKGSRRALLAAAGALLVLVVPAAASAQGSVQNSAQNDAQSNDHALTGAYNASGQMLFKALSAGPGNIVLSPYSIGTAMAMALAGARGETEREMARVLEQRLPGPQIDAANARVLKILNGYDTSAATPTCPVGLQLMGDRCEAPQRAGGQCPLMSRPEGGLCVGMPIRPPSAKLLVANALMLANADVSKSYMALLKDQYAAEVFERVRLDDVNGWVNRKTEGKIDKILDRLSDVTLINAVYFKSRWASTFDAKHTKDEPFHLTRARQAPVPMMQQRNNYAVVERRGYRAIRLPYAVRALGMVVVLPNEIDGLSEVAGRLDADAVVKLFTALRERSPAPVALALPRFKSEFKADLMKVFQQLGMALPFNLERADFSGLTGRPPAQAPTAIDQIVHRAVIEVAEESTEAAAATAIGIVVASAPRQPEPIVFRADRPFLYFIVDDATGAILFQGRLADPR